MEEKIRDHSDDHEPQTSLICVENTQNFCGGKVLPLNWLNDVSIKIKILSNETNITNLLYECSKMKKTFKDFLWFKDFIQELLS